ncbi:HDIG domain-containing metalloprotein [Amnibacterium kyonggiense]|uniref:Putative nucleotidyltransferase with HDIG domain n=1 Tax=Amnibacterium kyonggiense TaxID=595671 RepID=A0A4R7FPB5_9MICO|nr:HDIG domain-containing metalloprotein [Amnibacterium kyonggiense]TDS79496.1 putative nucleotidyltransferase with HDIG domain [Amnibacterium kyonggiense]
MSTEQQDRELIRAADEYLTEHYEVVVDDVVLRAWGSGRTAIVHEDLVSAVRDAGGVADPVELLPVAQSIAFPEAASPWLSRTERLGVVEDFSSRRVESARLLAGELLTRLRDGGQRWRHTQAVAARAGQAAHLFSSNDAEALVAAAWLHDVGYAPQLNRHGFHPVDGAEHVRHRLGWPGVAGLIAQHSGARFVAHSRGLGHLLRPFAESRFWSGPVADALTWADQTTGPDGRRVTVEDRIDEMLQRHGTDSPNARSNTERAPALVEAVRATEERLGASAF